MSKCSKCGLRGEHYSCDFCGLHWADHVRPCARCHTFRFTKVSAEVEQPAAEPQEPEAPKAKKPKALRPTDRGPQAA